MTAPDASGGGRSDPDRPDASPIGGHHPPSIVDEFVEARGATRVDASLPGDAEFALCLTHDVDRPYKGLPSLYYALRERPIYHTRTALSSANPYWQFEAIADLEADLGVRSAFYFLDEQHLLLDRPLSDWTSPTHWIEHLGRYDVESPDIARAVRELDDGGWEIGLHGSYHSPEDEARLREEKDRLESVLGDRIVGGRQHHLRLSFPETWRHHRSIGLRYDASLGSGETIGFDYGYRPLRPFDDEFVAFSLTIMEQALPDPGQRYDAARDACDEILREAARNDAVATALWHPRYFDEREFPGYRRLYRWLVERALELGAWVGSPRELYRWFESGADLDRSDESRRRRSRQSISGGDRSR
ncbi:polysaccharide deacetylase family protein [Natronoarchaeum rubrum]|uniref:polysaccharide deacetylase family protein n=1 Tax=Natronoarchaeum rubrum TaxID=755311 RepID=UPI0021126A31|nr:polysaccharide deacetylase family protein [Natronoarchaeum rubrum]